VTATQRPTAGREPGGHRAEERPVASGARTPAADSPPDRRRGVPLGASERRALLLAGDLAVLLAVAAIALRLGAMRSDWPWSAAFVAARLPWFVVLAALWIGLAWANGLYDLRRAPDPWAAAVLSIKVSAEIVVLWALVYFVPPPWTLVRHVVVFFTAGAAIAMPVWRQLYARVFSHPAFRRRVLIVGAGRAGRTILSVLAADAPHDFEVLGFVDDDPGLQGKAVDGVPVVAGGADLVAAAHRTGATELVLAVTHGVHRDLFSALMDAREQGLAVTPMPVLYESIAGRVPVEQIGDHWAVALPLDPPQARGLYPLVRRAIDVVAALLGLSLLALLLPVVAVCVRLDSHGPVIYRQQRVGRGGRPFTLYKVRTMVADSEPDGPVWASAGDPRVTRVGRWLRATRLDELPQLLNVLRGEMALVGPRPERPAFVEALALVIPFYRARHAVRPGLTGWATIHEGYAGTAEDALVKLQRDLYYIKHQSLFLDAYILFRTAADVLRLAGR
jgi:exopolysaccharide biosynthesis polyprenyl glycosylphosphotransferase